MNSDRDTRIYIEDILEAITKIEEYMKGARVDDVSIIIPRFRMLF